MPKPRILPCLPLVVWFAVGAWFFGRSLIPADVAQPFADRSIPVPGFEAAYTVPGFEAIYTETTGSWRWKYTRQMPDGCTLLMMPDSSAVTVDQERKLIFITLKTYKEEKLACSMPAVSRSFSGRINYDADATFVVRVDDKQVVP